MIAIQGNGRAPQSGSESERQEQLANGLGWFSIGLGLAELATPGTVAQLIGVQDEDRTRAVLRFYGFREIAAGIGILSQPRPAEWVWARVGGDLLDLASLGYAFGLENSDRAKLGTAIAAVLGVTALDVYCAQQLSQGTRVSERAKEHRPSITRTIIINRSPEEVYEFWHNFQKLPTFMHHLESVKITGEKQSHWKAKGPLGISVEWDAETVEDEPNTRISWRSLPGSDVYNSGSVRFERAPGGRGTVLRVELEYAPPGGKISAQMAKLLGKEPGQQIADDLRAFKQIMETGEVVHSDASIHSGRHPAQPASKY